MKFPTLARLAREIREGFSPRGRGKEILDLLKRSPREALEEK